MRIKLSGKLLSVIIALVLLVGLVPAVAAYEAHIIDIKAHVKWRPNIIKTMRPATDGEIATANASGINFPHTPYTDNSSVYQDGEGVWHVPVGECIVWMVEITLINAANYTMTDVMVRDHFSAELTGMDGDNVTVNYGTVGDGIYWLRKAGQLGFNEHRSENPGPVIFYYRMQDPPEVPQFTVFWYATYVGADPHMNQPVKENDLRNKVQPVFNGAGIGPGKSTTLRLMVWTRLNPSEQQRYTSGGRYTLNSGPTAWWRDMAWPPEQAGHYSTSAPSLPVIVP